SWRHDAFVCNRGRNERLCACHVFDNLVLHTASSPDRGHTNRGGTNVSPYVRHCSSYYDAVAPMQGTNFRHRITTLYDEFSAWPFGDNFWPAVIYKPKHCLNIRRVKHAPRKDNTIRHHLIEPRGHEFL